MGVSSFMSQPNTSEVSAKLQALRARFSAKTAGEFGALETISRCIGSGDADCQQLEQAYRILHRLAGSAGTFGFSRLGDQAKMLELQVKPYVDDCTDMASAIANLGGDFRQHLTNLRALLDIDDANVTTEVSDASQPAEDEPLVLIVEPDQRQGESLAKSLALYGYQSQWLPELENCLHQPDLRPSIIVIRDEEFLRESAKLMQAFADLPVICLSANDSFDHRYTLASAGAEAFFCEPLNLPVMADHLERLLTDHADAATGR